MPRKPAVTPLADEHAAPGGVATIDRALSVLAAFDMVCGTPTLTEIANYTRISPSTVLRMLASLEHAGFVLRQENGRYALGSSVERLHRVYSNTFSLEHLVVPKLKELVEQTGESAAYFVPLGDQRLCLYRVDSNRQLRPHINAGETLPIQTGAAGYVLMAYSPAPSPLAASERAKVLKQQFISLCGDRNPDVAGISAPVFAATGTIAGALTLIMPANRHSDIHAPLVQSLARSLTVQLGGTYPTAPS